MRLNLYCIIIEVFYIRMANVVDNIQPTNGRRRFEFDGPNHNQAIRQRTKEPSPAN